MELESYRTAGIEFAVNNLRSGDDPRHDWGAGTAADAAAKGLPGESYFDARTAFLAGVHAVGSLPQRTLSAIRGDNSASIDWEWSNGRIPRWLFPYVRDMGVNTRVLFDEHGDPLDGVEWQPGWGPVLTTEEAAGQLGISAQGVRKLILRGRLPAYRAGRDWLVAESALQLVQDRKRGWQKGKPRKQQE